MMHNSEISDGLRKLGRCTDNRNMIQCYARLGFSSHNSIKWHQSMHDGVLAAQQPQMLRITYERNFGAYLRKIVQSCAHGVCDVEF